MLCCYRLLTALAAPFFPFYLRARLARGKEDGARLEERFGHASRPRPEGNMLWIHAASVGEAQSVLPLITHIRTRYPGWQVLVTTGTVTSAKLLQERLPEGAFHQYVPVDTLQAVKRFLAHWQPQAALWVESELWPNLVQEAHAHGCRMVLINARMSETSFQRWRRFPGSIRQLLGCFTMVFAQSEADRARFAQLGATSPQFIGNLKYDAPPLPADTEALTELKAMTGARPIWLAASIHPGEAQAVLAAHALLREEFPDLLLILAPRHPEKGAEMAEAPLRSRGQKAEAEDYLYIADTLGELGTLYRLCGVAFIGGSLIPHGGQNPLEAARLGCALCFGPSMFNFTDSARGLLTAGGAIQVSDARSLAEAVEKLLTDKALRARMAANAQAWVEAQGRVTEALLAALTPLFEGRGV